MDIKKLLYITEIAKAGTLSAAGKKLGVAQPTLSAYLSHLEATLGVDLFLRERRRMIPTAAGKIYLDAAERIIDLKSQIYQQIHLLTRGAEESITVGVTPLRGAIKVAHIYPQFTKRFPGVKIAIREGYLRELREWVRDGSVNFAFGSCFDTESTEFQYIVISKEEIVLGVPAFHPLAHLASQDLYRLTSIRIEQFADSPFILNTPNSTIRRVADSIFAKAGVEPTVVFEADNNLFVSHMIRQGAGVGFLSRAAVADKFDQDIVYFALKPSYFINLNVIVQKYKILTEAERYFLYLSIQNDRENPLYLPADNPTTLKICEEFQTKEEFIKE